MGPGELKTPDERVALERKTAGLLAYLALEGPSPRALLAGLLWPESGERQARTNLRKVLSRLKPWSDLLEGSDILHLGDKLSCDLLRRNQGGVTPAAELLAGHNFDDCVDFAEWLWLWRERLKEESIAILQVELGKLETETDFQAALGVAKQLIRLEPLSEVHYRRAMRLHFFLGDRAAALETYHRCQTVLKESLGLEPLPETQNLARDIEQRKLMQPKQAQGLPLDVLHLPFVGRERAWQSLEAAYQKSQIILLTAPAGMGKSRLIQEFFASKAEVCILKTKSGEEALPYASLAHCLKGLVKGELKEALESWVLLELSRFLPELQSSESAFELADERLLQACVELFQGFGFETLVIEDLHYWDEASFELLRQLPKSLPDLDFLFSFRPLSLPDEYRASLQVLEAKGIAHSITLEPLGLRAVEALFAQLSKPIKDKSAAEFHALTGGNPLYLSETLKNFVKTGKLSLKESVFEERLKQLSESAEQLVWALAINGGRLELELMAAMLSTRPLALAKNLHELLSVELLKEDALSHDLLTEYVLNTLPAPLKTLLHSRAAQFLAQNPEHITRTAEHWLNAKELAKAVSAWQQAASYLYDKGLSNEAVTMLERALSYAREDSQLAYRLAKLYSETGRYDQAFALAEQLLASSTEPWIEAKAQYILADYLLTKGQVAEAQAKLKQAEKLATYVKDDALAQDFRLLKMHIAHAQSDFQAMHGYAAELLEAARQQHQPVMLARALSDMGIAASSLGQVEESLHYHYEARALAKRYQLNSQVFASASNLAVSYAFLGDIAKAAALSEEALAVGKFHGHDTVRGNLAVFYTDLGLYDKALELSLDLAASGAQMQERIYAYTRLAELYFLTGQTDKIDKALEEAIDLVEVSEDSSPRLRTLINTFKYGSKTLQTKLKSWIKEIRPQHIRHDMRKELEDLGLLPETA